MATRTDPRVIRTTGADRQWDAVVAFPDPGEDNARMTARLAVSLGEGRPEVLVALTVTEEGIAIDVFGEDAEARNRWEPVTACWAVDSELARSDRS